MIDTRNTPERNAAAGAVLTRGAHPSAHPFAGALTGGGALAWHCELFSIFGQYRDPRPHGLCA